MFSYSLQHHSQAKTYEQPKCPLMDELINNSIYKHVVVFDCKTEENTVICDNMDLEEIMSSKITQTEKDKYHIITLICRIFKKVKLKHRGVQEIRRYWSKNTYFVIR